MHNFGTVLSFEITRALKKKSFWVMALLFPIIIVGIFLIAFLSGKATSNAAEQLANEKFSIAVIDDSGLVKPEILQATGANEVTDKAGAVSKVRHGDLDAFIYYPADLTKESIEVYAKDVGIFEDSRYQGVASEIIKQSVDEEVPASARVVLQGNANVSLTTYRGGEEYDPIKQMILPGIFLVLFYFLIAFFGNQILTATTEEKENRVVEMLLTTVQPRTLIIGKIIALILIALIQAIIIILPALVGYLLLHDQLSLPSFDLTSLPVDGMAITIGALAFVLSLLFFIGLLALIGTLVPTAKEAGQFFGVVMILIFGPLYAVTLFVSSPSSSIVTFLTLFPLTAPIPLMIRNAIGNLQGWETTISLLLLAISTVIVMALVIRAFRYGALEYSKKLSLKQLFPKR